MTIPVELRLVNAACFAAWALTLLPAIVYLRTGWDARRDRLLGALTPRALKLYYDKFRGAAPEATDLKKAFKQHFGHEYGRRHYAVPLLFLAIVAGVGLWMTARTLHVWLGLGDGDIGFPPIAVSGFLGALAWILGDQLSRLRTQDFTPYDVYGCAYRVLIAVPVSYGFAALASKDFGVPLAFMLGAFPTGTLTTITRRVAAQRLGLGDTDTGAISEVGQLQGVGKAHAERFQEEGLNTIVEMAWADPIDLTIRTNFDLWFVVDCVSQALLWIYLGPKVLELGKLSLRGAMEASCLLQDLESEDVPSKAAAASVLNEAAIVLQMRPESLLHTLEEVARDPFTAFLCDIWEEQPGDQSA